MVLIMTMIRIGFVSNSSSSSFVIPKKILTDDELHKYQTHRLWESTYDNEDIYETEHYICGRIRNDNVLNNILKNHMKEDGVEYYES
jgi:hypothetical protein